MNDDFSKYESMKRAGSSAEQTWRQATSDGLDKLTKIRLIRAIYSLSLIQAKEIYVQAEYGQTLDQYQGEIAKALEQLEREHPEYFS